MGKPQEDELRYIYNGNKITAEGIHAINVSCLALHHVVLINSLNVHDSIIPNKLVVIRRTG